MRLLPFVTCLWIAVGCTDAKKRGPDVPPSPATKPIGMPAAAAVAPLATASNTFAFELWRKAAPAGNAALSPASITTALAMTWGGAKGGTSDEMK